MSETILLVDDQAEVRDYVSDVLADKGFEVECAETAEEGMATFREKGARLTLVILDLDLGDDEPDGLELLTRMKKENPEIPVVILSGKGTTETAVKAIKLGAQDFLEKDTYLEENLKASMTKMKRFLDVVDGYRRLQAQKNALEREADLYHRIIRDKYRIVGRSEAFKRVLEKARGVSSIPRPVLIRGERGTGKELVAATIHYSGSRRKKPFITVNCAAFHGNLLESEMFGHEKGAFTGADKRKIGRFEQADGGTLFLDEVGNMSLEFQEKILRVIEYQTFERVAGSESISVDVRVIAATNANLEQLMEEGEFRKDFYDRLSFETLRIPPLRERPADIPVLVDHFAEQFATEVAGVEPKRFSPEAMETLKTYAWPGNVRELKNTVERLVYSTPSDVIEASHLPLEVIQGKRAPATGFKERIAELEQRMIAQALLETGHNQKEAAEKLELTYDQFRHYYRKYDFKKPSS